MKLISKRGARVKDNVEETDNSKPIDNNENNDITPQIPGQIDEVSPAAPAPKPASKPVPKPVYPKAALSDKQLETLKKVIGPSAQGDSSDPEQGSRDPAMSSDDAADPGKKKKKKKRITNPDEIVIKDRSVAKIIFWVLFIVLLLAGAGLAGFYYWWTEYATFEYELQPVVILDGQNVSPGSFLAPVEEMTGVSAVFQNTEFEPAIGLQYVPMTLHLGLRTVEASAALFVLTPIESIVHEFTEEGMPLRPVEFLANPEVAARVPFDIRFTEPPLPLDEYPVGEFTLRLALNDAPFEVTLHIVDTTPPSAISVDHMIIIGEMVSPADFVTEVFDASPIESITFVSEPDVFAFTPEQPVQVVVEDIYSNSATFSATLFIQYNEFPPVIEGVTELFESETGAFIDFLQGVTAYDDFGRVLDVHVNTDEVDIDTEGTYTAFIWAEDYTGLYSEVEVTVHILRVSPEYIYSRADDILSSIIRDSMTQAQKVRAINEWIRWSIRTETTETTSESFLANAYKAIDERKGDYHVFAAISELLLTRAGIPNMRIERIAEAETGHVWNLVNPDERGWHHFDTFPNSLGLGSNSVSMFTGAQAKTFAERIETRSKIKDYYTYDPDLYPEIVKGD